MIRKQLDLLRILTSRDFGVLLTITVILVSFFFGCSPSSLSDFEQEGIALNQQICEELKKITTQEQLIRAEPEIKKYFESLALLMIETRLFHENHPDDPPFEPNEASHIVSKGLELELKRLYLIEGGREMIERAQQEGLVKLGVFEQTLIKKRERYKNRLK